MILDLDKNHWLANTYQLKVNIYQLLVNTDHIYAICR